MARKYELLSEMYDKTTKTMTNPVVWRHFLESACRNYRLRFDEQLLVFVQRPDATAVLEIERWNKQFGRWVNRGANGIAVFEDAERNSQRLKYYFDISDTHESRLSRPVPIWNMREEYTEDVIDTLESTFGTLENRENLEEAILSAANNAVEDNVPDYVGDLLLAMDDTLLYGLTEDTARYMYNNIVTHSVAYMLMTRLGADTSLYYSNEEFKDIVNFNTEDALNALGYATGDISEMALSEIAKTVLSLDRANRTFDNPQRSEYNNNTIQPERRLEHDRDSLHQTGRLQSAQPDLTRTAEGRAGDVRSDEAQIPERASQDPVLQPPDEMQADREPVRDRTDGAEDGERSYPSDGTGSGRDGAVEGAGSDDMGTPDEQHPTGGERNRDGQGDLHRITPDGQTQRDDEPALSLSTTFGLADRIYDYLTDYIINFYEEADEEPLEVAEDGSDPVVVARIEHDLHDTEIMRAMLEYFSETYDRRDNDEEINEQYDLIVDAVKERIDSLEPFDLDDRFVSGDTHFDVFDEDGERLKYPFFGVDEVVNEIFATTPYFGASLEDIGAYLEGVSDTDRRIEYIRSIFNNDFTEIILADDTRVGYKTYDNGVLIWKGRYPSREGQRFLRWDAVAGHFDAMRKLGMLRSDIKSLLSQDGQLQYLADAAGANAPAFVFSQEIIDNVLTRGSNVAEGKMRIYEQFQKSLSRDENIRFLKNEYGIGGGSSAVAYTGISEMHDGKGIELSFGFDPDRPRQLLKWNYVEKRIRELISLDRYLNDKEKDSYPFWLEKMEGYREDAEREKQRRDEERRRQMEMETSPEERLQNEGVQHTYEYQYHLGDTVYIGASTYELLSIDDDRVMLCDPKFPLINTEMPRAEFEAKVQENPLNNHLRVPDNPDKETEQGNEIDKDIPDADPAEIRRKLEAAGIVNGQLVDEDKLNNDPFVQQVYADAERVAQEEQEQPEEVKLHSVVVDLTPNESDGANSDLIGQRLTLDDREFEIKRVNAYGDVNMEDLTFRGETGFPVNRVEKVDFVRRALEEQRAKENEITPAWERQPRVKAQTFDLHPDIPMSQRHTFDLKHFELEEVGKKARFRRNADAIRVLKECQFDNRFATPEEQAILAQYVGWGGIPEAFDEHNNAWSNEFTELYGLLSPEEYASARASTLTAFYTPPVVINAIYKMMENMGFQRGNILEPSCGIGNFIGMLPDSMSDSRVFGVEIDTISAGIAQQLYQKSSIAAQPYEKAEIPDSFFDAVVGNVPFGDFGVSDKRYDKYHFMIHDFFFAKSLDKLRPGGVMALVTSRGTMDKENPAVRKYIAQRADLLGAVRLPNNTFKGNAGTDVVSDILILQKRDRIIDIEPSWVRLDTDANGITMNSYFVEHPDMILGEMKMVSGRFGMTADCIPYENADLGELLDEAVSNIHGEVTDYELDEDVEEDLSIPADPSVRNFSFTLVDGKIYFRENSRMTPFDVSATAQNRIKGMIPIRDSVRRLLEMQTENYPDDVIKAEQERLNTLYDNYTKKYGLINSRANNSAFSMDSSYSLISSLEVIDEEGNLERKADIFTKRTIRPHEPITSVDTASEALAVSMAERARVDMDFMSELSGLSEEKLYEDLKGVIFLNPLYGFGNNHEAKYLTSDEYLSGNVREKLRVAFQSAQLYPQDYAVNVEALRKVQPEDLKASEISVRLGATWLPVEDVQDFVYQLLDTPYYVRWKMKVHYSPITGEWNMENKTYDRTNVKAYKTYGTDRINAYQIIEQTLNLKDVRIYDYEEDPFGKKKAVLNKKETAIALAKQEQIKQQFQEWIWSDPSRRERLCNLYNEKFNNTRPREYDGSHIDFVGMNPEIELREHQRNAVAHILYGGNTLLAHAVGAGKTYEMAAAAMESKRLGLCNKSLFVVPNHLTEQWAAEFLQLYPAANILVATKKDFERKNRRRFCGRIATGDYDAVIIGHTQFEKIPISQERQIMMLQAQLDEITEGIESLSRNRGDNFTVKQLEKSRRSIKAKLEKLEAQDRKDDVVTFEELGVDRLFIDESHYYKNLYLYTKMRNVGGIAQTEAQKSSDLFMKCRYLDELTGSRGTVFATGTPISNSMVELYTIQRYLQYETLVKNDLQFFDSWASTFGETITAVELTPEGTGYRAKTRFAKFYNLPELMSMFREVADIQTSDMLNLPVPKANYHNIAVKPSEMQKEMVAGLGERAEKIRGGQVDSSEDNMLNITNDGRKLALDQRLLNPMLEDFDGSKVNACVDNVYRIWDETADQHSAQLLFCDLSTPKGEGEFSVYTDIRKKLIERGIPEDQIAFIHDAKTETQKLDLFRKVRKGEIRVLLGSTAKMGAGTNAQNKLIALHDLDCPWRPSDLEQRSGRIIRQGNENPEVHIYRYVTEETFDAYLYQLVEGKQKFCAQIMTSKTPVRTAEDVDQTALSYAEIKMLATGNPYIKEKMDLDIQVQKLQMIKAGFLSEKYDLEDKIIKYYPEKIAFYTGLIDGLKQDIEVAKKHPRSTDDTFVGMEIQGAFFDDKAKAGQAILDACKSMKSSNAFQLGSYRGFNMEMYFDTVGREYGIRLKGRVAHDVKLGVDVHGNITRLDNALDGMEKRLERAVSDLENIQKQFETAKVEVQKPFAQEEELRTKTARLNELNALLDVDKRDNEFVGGEQADVGDDVPDRQNNRRDAR